MTEAVQGMVGSHYGWSYCGGWCSDMFSIASLCVCDLKATLMNEQHSLIWELILFKFKWGHNAMDATKNIGRVKIEVTVH